MTTHTAMEQKGVGLDEFFLTARSAMERGVSYDEFLLANPELVFSLTPQESFICKATLHHYTFAKFGQTQTTGDLEEAICKAEQAIDATPEGHPSLGTILKNFGKLLADRFERTGRIEDLEEAIQKTKEAVQVTPGGHLRMGERLNSLSNRLYTRFQRTGRMSDLEEAIRNAEQAVDATPKGHLDLAGFLDGLSGKLVSRFALTRRMEDLENSIHKAEQALDAAPEGHSRRAGILSNLGLNLKLRFEQLRRTDDLVEAIRRVEQAVESTPVGDPGLARWLINLSTLLESRFEETGKMEDLEEAICVAEKAVDAVHEGQPELAGALHNLGNMLSSRFKRTGRIGDLEEAICKAKKAMKVCPAGDSKLAPMLCSLAVLLHRQFEQTGRMEDLEEAIRLAEKAEEGEPVQIWEQELDATPGPPGSRLNELGTMYRSRFERTGRMEHLEEAIRKIEQAVHATPETHRTQATYLSNLGSMLGSRFERTGLENDLDQAIQKAEQSVKATPAGDPKLALRLRNLGNRFSDRFKRTGRIGDLEEGIRNARRALVVAPEGDPDLAIMLNNLATMLQTRFTRTEKAEDLEEAIQKAEQAVTISPKSQRYLPMMLTNLGNMLGDRFILTRKMEDLEEAIFRAQQAVETAPEGHLYLGLMLDNLGILLRARFRRLGRMEDLDEAIRTTEQAVKAIPEDHSEQALALYNLGILFGLSSKSFHKDQALESFLKSWECYNGTPVHRIRSALRAIRLLREQEAWNQASKLAKHALDLLPIVNSRSLNRDDQQYIMSEFSGLAADACSLSLKAGDNAVEALKLLELGRGVIIGYLIDGRSDISELRESCAEKAALYDRLRTEVNSPIPEAEEPNVRQDFVKRRIAAVRELEDCLCDIRRLPGHEQFLLAPTEEELKSCAAEGPIVVINITDIRSDAIIVSTTAVKAIELPNLTASEALKWIEKDLSRYEEDETPQQRGKKNKQYCQFLSWLWSAAIKQILQELESGEKLVSHKLPRIWWIGVGLASSLPFHAAGDHFGESENTLSRAISSYTPTIKALIHARKQMSTVARSSDCRSKLLVVAMPTTPGERALPGVSKEMSAIEVAARSAFSVESLIQPNVEKLLDQMKHCNVVHFACHGFSDFRDPSNSHLLLQDVEESQSTRPDKLTVQRVSGINLEQAQIAYLSACSTAENSAVQLADEVIHLASGFQVAGFGHVIGSMWPSDDNICVQVARGFYEQLSMNWHVQESNRAVAAALHDSLLKVRSDRRKQPLAWAQYIHFGA